MWRAFSAALALLLAGCVQILPSEQDIAAKTFKPVPGKSVIYIVRGALGPPLGDTLSLNDKWQITTWTGTYYRWEVEPGIQHIEGFGPSGASITMTTKAGRIYFVEHSVIGNSRDDVQNTFLQQLDDRTGRAFVKDARLL